MKKEVAAARSSRVALAASALEAVAGGASPAPSVRTPVITDGSGKPIHEYYNKPASENGSVKSEPSTSRTEAPPPGQPSGGWWSNASTGKKAAVVTGVVGAGLFAGESFD